MSNALPTTRSLPEWSARLARRVTMREEGVAVLPEGMILSAEDRTLLRAEAARLRAGLVPASADRRAAAAELLGLFAAFPAQALSERTAEARSRHYLDAVAAFPIGALRDAIGMWMRGEAAGPHDNHAFPPSPPQLARLCRLAMQPAFARITELEALAAARPAPAPPSAEARERVAALVERFRRPEPKEDAAGA